MCLDWKKHVSITLDTITHEFDDVSLKRENASCVTAWQDIGLSDRNSLGLATAYEL